MVDVHLCLIINPASVLDFLDFGGWSETLSYLVLHLETFNTQALMLEAYEKHI